MQLKNLIHQNTSFYVHFQDFRITIVYLHAQPAHPPTQTPHHPYTTYHQKRWPKPTFSVTVNSKTVKVNRQHCRDNAIMFPHQNNCCLLHNLYFRCCYCIQTLVTESLSHCPCREEKKIVVCPALVVRTALLEAWGVTTMIYYQQNCLIIGHSAHYTAVKKLALQTWNYAQSFNSLKSEDYKKPGFYSTCLVSFNLFCAQNSLQLCKKTRELNSLKISLQSMKPCATVLTQVFLMNL